MQNLSVVVIGLAITEIAALLLVVDVVMRPRSSQGAIAWSIGLIALPFLTVPLYLIFGRTSSKVTSRRFEKRRNASAITQ
jgi:cardiolipin synthase